MASETSFTKLSPLCRVGLHLPIRVYDKPGICKQVVRCRRCETRMLEEDGYRESRVVRLIQFLLISVQMASLLVFFYSPPAEPWPILAAAFGPLVIYLGVLSPMSSPEQPRWVHADFVPDPRAESSSKVCSRCGDACGDTSKSVGGHLNDMGRYLAQNRCEFVLTCRRCGFATVKIRHQFPTTVGDVQCRRCGEAGHNEPPSDDEYGPHNAPYVPGSYGR